MGDAIATVEQSLQDVFGDRLFMRRPLAPFTTLQIGGPAEYLVLAASARDIIEARRLSNQFGLRFTFLAGCSNVLIDDAGLDGIVVINQSAEIEWHDDFTVTVDGGFVLDRFIEEASARGWADVSFAAGIPGSLGGAIAGGAGAFGHLVHEYMIEAEVLTCDGRVVAMNVDDLGVTYRNSLARGRGDIIVRLTMGGFEPGDRETLMENIRSIKAQREEKHPRIDQPSAGSFFKNLPPAEPGGRRIPAGKYLDEAGAKGMHVGGAGVFDKHANIIINYGGATSDDVNRLADAMAAMVKDRFGIDLEREVQYLK